MILDIYGSKTFIWSRAFNSSEVLIRINYWYRGVTQSQMFTWGEVSVRTNASRWVEPDTKLFNWEFLLECDKGNGMFDGCSLNMQRWQNADSGLKDGLHLRWFFFFSVKATHRRQKFHSFGAWVRLERFGASSDVISQNKHLFRGWKTPRQRAQRAVTARHLHRGWWRNASKTGGRATRTHRVCPNGTFPVSGKTGQRGAWLMAAPPPSPPLPSHPISPVSAHHRSPSFDYFPRNAILTSRAHSSSPTQRKMADSSFGKEGVCLKSAVYSKRGIYLSSASKSNVEKGSSGGDGPFFLPTTSIYVLFWFLIRILYSFVFKKSIKKKLLMS